MNILGVAAGRRPRDNVEVSEVAGTGRSPPLRGKVGRRAARYIRERTGRCQGLPSGLDFETLDALCREHGRRGLKRCVHLRLSGWKPRGAYRLELLTESGASWRLIFKDECYWSARNSSPCSKGYRPIRGRRSDRLPHATALPRAILPQLFWFREIEPGRHFQYLLEDLPARIPSCGRERCTM